MAKIAQAIGQHFKLYQERLSKNHQEAAEILAKSVAFLSFDSEGKPSLEAMMFETKGLETLSREARIKIAEQMSKAIVEGKPIPQQIVGPPVVQVQGLQNLSEADRLEVLEQIKKAFQEGKPLPRNIEIGSRTTKVQGSSGLVQIVLAALVLGAPGPFVHCGFCRC